jgi:hypothetical protein
MSFLRKIFNLIVYAFAIFGALLMLAFVVSKTELTNRKSIVDGGFDYFSRSRKILEQENYLWLNSPEYIALKSGMRNEKVVLDRVQNETGVSPRLLQSILFVEQMRLFNSERELFKKVFEPLKILGVQSQYSWGVLGLKQETLIQIEENLASSTSPFYLGPDQSKKFGELLAFNTEKIDEERFNRITDSRNHYFTYLYAALYIKQIEKQWENAGFDISSRPEILATLYNIGFSNSKPNPNPQVGGAEIEISVQKYSFGRLAFEFYYSDELIEEFPR